MKLKPSIYAPILLGVVLLLVGFSDDLVRLIDRVSPDSFLSLAIIQFLVFLLPLAFYCRVFGINPVASLKLRGFSWKKVPVLVAFLLLFFIGSLTLRYFGIFVFDGAMVDTPDAIRISGVASSNGFFSVLCFAVIPAILEEILFRGILLEDYAPFGAGIAVTVTALGYAMLHASFSDFAYYFFVGVIFGAVSWISGSVIPAILFHLLRNLWYLYAAESAANYLRQAGRSALLPFILIALVLLLLFFLFSRMEELFRDRARDEMRETRRELLEKEILEEKAAEAAPKPNRFHVLREVFLSPSFLVVVAVFLLQAFHLF